MKRTLLFLAILALLFTACSPSVPSTIPSQTSITPGAEPASTSYPPFDDGSSLAGNYPVPTVDMWPGGTPTVDQSLGIVKGQLYLQGKPVNRAVLFLADLVKDSEGNERLVSVDYNTKNRAVTIQDGSFTFVNIPSQRYVLVLVDGIQSYVLMIPGTTENAIIVDVKNGMQEDLGRLDFDALPIGHEN